MRRILPLLLLSALALSACEEKPVERHETVTVSDGTGGVVRVRTDQGQRTTIKGKDGQNTSVSTVAADVKLPDFAPAYPGSKPQEGRTGLVSENAKGKVTQITYITTDSPEKVADFYKTTLNGKSGTTVSAMGGGSNAMVQTSGKTGNARINIRQVAGTTRIVMTVTEEPQRPAAQPAEKPKS